jgi:hypothetical protein
MKTYNVEIEGLAPLLQNKMPDDLEVNEKKGEGKNTAEGCAKKLYMLDGKICQPATHLEQGLIKMAAGIKQKGQGKKSYKELFKGSIFIKPDYIIHKIQKWEVFKTTAVIPATHGRITTYRPMLPKWKLEFEVQVLDDRIGKEIVKMAIDEMGRTNGLGDWRPRYGRFLVNKFEEV